MFGSSNIIGSLGSEFKNTEYRNYHNILLIEDNPADARLVQILLEEADFGACKYTNKTSLGEAISELSINPDYDVVLLDLTLPDSRGFETLSILISSFPNINVIVMTGLSDKELGLKAVKAGAQDFIVKGIIDGESLAKAMRYSIERSNVLKRLEEAQRLANIGNWEYNSNGRAVTVSDEVFRIFGIETLDKRIDLNQLSCNDYPVAIFADIHSLAKEHGHVNKDISITTPAGIQKHITMQCKMVRFDQGVAVMSGIVQDITSRVQSDRLRKERDLATQSAKMKEHFIANISHEMRTPMNAILGMSNILLKTPLIEEQLGYLKSIKQSSEVLLGIVNDILEISTLQNGKIMFDFQDFHLYDMMNNLVEVMQYKKAEKPLQFQLTYDKSEIPAILNGDKLRLNQILYNLVGNAIKFTDAGFVKIRIDVVSRIDKKMRLKFEIEDSGIGIPEDKIVEIFESFSRVQSKERFYEGTGLGLSIAKNLVEQQGGSIGARSTVGSGSTFFFELDFLVSVATTVASDVKKDLSAIDTTRPLRLLLVEDNKMNQLVARKTLEKQWSNLSITVADNGAIAVEILQTQDFDIILMDMQMPVMDGYEATLHIRNNMGSEKAKTPILAMTANAYISKEENVNNIGLDDYVLKPFDPEDLLMKIHQYAKRR